MKFSGYLVANLFKLIATVISIVASYYLAIILHEWGHGTVAWLLGYKKSLFDVDYGGWLLLHADENVPYDQILATNQGFDAACIGIAGVSVTIVLFLVSLVYMNKIRRSVWSYSFFYWFAILNMVAIFQYLIVQTFSVQGDVGRFVHGLNISPWWVFIPGSIFVYIALHRFFKYDVPKAYAIISIKTLWVRRIFLLISLSIMFLLIYTHGYNPLTDKGMPFIGKILAVCSMLLVPILFFFCNPSNNWVKKEILKNRP